MTYRLLNEPILSDDYPVYPGYFYVADNKVIQSDIEGSVGYLKKMLKAKVITRCDIVGRTLIATNKT